MYGWGIRQNYGTFASKFTYICKNDNLYIHTMLCDIHLNDEELSNLFLLICDEDISNLYLFIYFILGTTIKDDTEVDLAIIIGASVGGFVALLIIIIIICCHCLRTR